MMTNNKEFKIEFAPGAFDNFDGTQEELDELMAEIQNMFVGKSRKEIEALSTPISDDDFDELPDDVKLQLIRSYGEDSSNDLKRKLQ